MSFAYACALALCGLTHTSRVAGEPEPNRLLVPLGGEAILDGVIDPLEWADARKIGLHPEGTAWVKHDEEFVYIALRASGSPMTSVQVLEEDHVELLHVSAALGAIRYVADDDGWHLTSKPQWSCRATDESAKAAEERGAFLAEHSWLGTNMGMGKRTEVELKLATARFAKEKQATLVLAAVDAGADGDVLRWPVGVTDDVVSRPLLAGPFSDEASFATESWGRLVLSPDFLEDLEGGER